MNVLFPVDGSPQAKNTMYWAYSLLDPAETQVHLLHVVYWTEGALVRDDELESAKLILAESRAFWESRGFSVAASETVLGTPSAAICQYADEHQVDQIIMGSHGYQGFKKLWMGSVSEGVFKRAKQPVLLLAHTKDPVVHVSHLEKASLRQSGDSPQRVVLPVDDSDAALNTMAWACHFLDASHTELHVLHVIDTVLKNDASQAQAQDLLAKAEALFKRNGFKNIVVTLKEGIPAHEICHYADTVKADEILIGAQGLSNRPEILMGSVSEYVYKHAKQPVIVVNNGVEKMLTISHAKGVRLSE